MARGWVLVAISIQTHTHPLSFSSLLHHIASNGPQQRQPPILASQAAPWPLVVDRPRVPYASRRLCPSTPRLHRIARTTYPLIGNTTGWQNTYGSRVWVAIIQPVQNLYP
ncbi:hypothetical protein H4582DRAFT_656123 [Lactarius indigo]|nr:hypothetical protein H4582DRAFT_656123 [Lactarius indigo]